jgi:hypothetical protein
VTVGLGTGILVDYTKGLPASDQAVLADAIQHYNQNGILGDPASVSLVLGVLGWVVAMVAAAFAFRRAGAGWPSRERVCSFQSAPLFANAAETRDFLRRSDVGKAHEFERQSRYRADEDQER